MYNENRETGLARRRYDLAEPVEARTVENSDAGRCSRYYTGVLWKLVERELQGVFLEELM
jgi:hypothetical protein